MRKHKVTGFLTILILLTAGSAFAQSSSASDTLITNPLQGDISALQLKGNITLVITKAALNQIEIRADKKATGAIKYSISGNKLLFKAPPKTVGKVEITLSLKEPNIHKMECKGDVNVIYK